AGLGALAPELPALEADAIEGLRLSPAAVGVSVGQRVDAVEALDRAVAAAGVPRQARVARRVRVPGQDPVAGAEARRQRRLALRGAARPDGVEQACAQRGIVAARVRRRVRAKGGRSNVQLD